jgi:hypothetical protein
MKTNTVSRSKPQFTHEGGRATKQSPINELLRTVTNCLLFEDTFYEKGNDIAERIQTLIPQCDPYAVSDLAIYTRNELGLRHVSLYVAACMAKHFHVDLRKTFEDDYTRWSERNGLVSYTIYSVIKRADELSEFLSLYWKINKKRGGKNAPLSGQVKKGLASAFVKFDEYALGKYNRDSEIKLRDVLFLSHAMPMDTKQEALWKKLIDGSLAVPDTWETQLSAGANKKDTFTRLIKEGKLGSLALLRNLRNMHETGVERSVIRDAMHAATFWGVLPYQFIAAAQFCPEHTANIEAAMLKTAESYEKLSGTTVFLVDNSGSMYAPMAGKSKMNRVDAAGALAIQLREQCEDVRIFVFSTQTAEVPAHRGFALAQAIRNGPGGGTNIEGAINYANQMCKKYDRIVLLTDEQAHDGISKPLCRVNAYLVNIAPHAPGLSTSGGWQRINGFSTKLVDWILAVESE